MASKLCAKFSGDIIPSYLSAHAVGVQVAVALRASSPLKMRPPWRRLRTTTTRNAGVHQASPLARPAPVPHAKAKRTKTSRRETPRAMFDFAVVVGQAHRTPPSRRVERRKRSVSGEAGLKQARARSRRPRLNCQVKVPRQDVGGGLDCSPESGPTRPMQRWPMRPDALPPLLSECRRAARPHKQ